MERRILKVLKALAGVQEHDLGDLLEGIVLHAFEGQGAISAETLRKIADLKATLRPRSGCRRAIGSRRNHDRRVVSRCAGELPARRSRIRHAAHVRAAYLYLRTCDSQPSSACATPPNHAARTRKPGRYHETITVAYLALIGRHLWEHGDGGGWAAFARRHPELFEPDLLLHYYPKAELDSEVARKTSVCRSGASAGSAGRLGHPAHSALFGLRSRRWRRGGCDSPADGARRGCRPNARR